MLEVLEASGPITIQDSGRRGWRRFGVPAAGPMDELAFAGANLLAGNPNEAAMLEIGGGDILLRAMSDCTIAVTGAGYGLTVNVWEYPLWGSYFVRKGWMIRLEKSGFGMWTYLAVTGGIEAPVVLGSRSTYLRGRFGGMEGRAIQAGDLLRPGEARHAPAEAAGRSISSEGRPTYTREPLIEFVRGPQSESIGDQSWKTLTTSSYQVGAASDRMGYRLEGPRLKHRGSADLLSEGMTAGSIQVPADGAAIIMMADCATTGGYPKIGCVIRADLPLLAQCTPGKDHVQFRETTVEAAQQKYRTAVQRMKSSIIEEDDEAALRGAG